jgi:hypothetical protein
MRVRLYDRAVYAGGKSEIVRIDDQAPHEASLAGWMEQSVRGPRFCGLFSWQR